MIKPEPLDKTDIENIASDAVSQAIDFVESEISLSRIKAQRYFDGETDIGYEEGRSKVVATKVRDTIRAIKPSLLRVFLNTDKPAEFIPKGPEDTAGAEQSTCYINWAFRENNGYKVLSDAFHDALVKKIGVVKIFWETSQKGEIHTFEGLSDEEFSMVVNEPDIEVLEHSEAIEMIVDPMGVEVENRTHDVKINRVTEEGCLRLEAVPSEEFFVDRNARSIEDAYVVAHQTEMRVGDLVAMGYDWDEVVDLSGAGDTSDVSEEEDFQRKGWDDDDSDQNMIDPSMRLVLVTEAYMRIDVDGTGVPMLHRLILGGNENKLLDYELWDDIPFAIFEVDPEPHAFYGRSVADLILEDQDASTAMLRGMLDNVALTNNPRMEVLDDGTVNIDDLLNNEIGAIVRVRASGAVQPLAVPFIAGSTLPAMQYLDQTIEAKTGVTKASMGLDPEALQNSTATAAQMTANAAAGQVEVIARNLAESGLKRMFKLMLALVIKHSPDQQMMRMQGQFVPVDPRVWNAGMDVAINVGLGTAQDDVKMQVLNQALQIQMQLAASGSPLVSMTLMRNTLADILNVGGYYNSERYFAPMNPQIEQQIMQQQAAQAAQQAQQGDPQVQAFLQAEQMKAQLKSQTEMAKIQAAQQAKVAEMQQRERIRGVEINEQREAKLAELKQRQTAELTQLQLKYQEAAARDDLERDRLFQELMIKAAEVYGQYGTAVDVANIQATQAAPRDAGGNV